MGALDVPAGRVGAMPLSPAVREEARAVRDDVLGRAGPMPPLPVEPAPAGAAAPAAAEPVSTRQRVADVLAPFLPPGTTLGSVSFSRAGAALEGRAPDEGAVRRFLDELNASGEVRSARLATTRKDGNAVAYRLLLTLTCVAPGERSVCLPGTSGRYSQQQVEDALRPVLGSSVMLERLDLVPSVGNSTMVELEGQAPDAEIPALLDRLRTQVPWLESSTSSTGKGRFLTRLRMVCAVPPRPGGICAVDEARR